MIVIISITKPDFKFRIVNGKWKGAKFCFLSDSFFLSATTDFCYSLYYYLFLLRAEKKKSKRHQNEQNIFISMYYRMHQIQKWINSARIANIEKHLCHYFLEKK